MSEYFAAKLMVFNDRGDDDPVVDKAIAVEVTDNELHGKIEIAFDDRGERLYLKFDLAQLMTALMHKSQTEA